MTDKSPAADAVMTVTGMMTSGVTQSELEDYLHSLPPDLRDAVAGVTCRVFADILDGCHPCSRLKAPSFKEKRRTWASCSGKGSLSGTSRLRQ